MSLAPLFRTDAADPAIETAIEAACARIAPSWPLDQLIAVNPLWGFTAQPLPAASARVEALAGSRLLMPRAWYAEQWHAGRLRPEHLQAAIEREGPTARSTRSRPTSSPPPRHPRGARS